MDIQLETARLDQWNEIIAALPGAHILQTLEWGQIKSRYGWQPKPHFWRAEGRVLAAALILQRSIPMPLLGSRLHVMYAPKGPLLDWRQGPVRERVMADLELIARQHGAIFIKIDPDVTLGCGHPDESNAKDDPLGQAILSELNASGWRFSDEQIQFRNTVLIDLAPTLDALLANMKQKTRYNIRLAQRKGVIVRAGNVDDLPALYRMYAQTSLRDGFVIRDEGYYTDVWTTFMRAGMAEPLIAEVDGELVAAVIVFRFADKAWYLYGMSIEKHRNKMPNYLLQWEAIRRAKTAGCQVYDLWGAPDVFDESDSMWGVYRFKSGLGGQVSRQLGAWDLAVRPFYYQVYTQALPRILNWMRKAGKARTQRTMTEGA